VRGHQPRPRAGAPPADVLRHRGNELADAWASAALALDEGSDAVVSRAKRRD
jgi:hypothetical protein